VLRVVAHSTGRLDELIDFNQTHTAASAMLTRFSVFELNFEFYDFPVRQHALFP
jgi:hypothetical protein